MNKLLRRTKNKKGFTLIELLVVLAILAVIALIAVPNFIGVRDSAIEDADKQTVELVQSAMELMVVSEDISTASSADLCTLDENGIVQISTPEISGLTNDILKKYINLDKGLQKSTTDITFTVTSGGAVTNDSGL